MRLAIAEVGQETCHFTSVRTTVETFRQYGLYEGEAILSKKATGAGYVAGFLKAAEEEQVDLQLVPLISGWASASGPLTAQTVQFLVEKIESGLRAAGKIDGFFFGLHGAAAAENEPDVEGVLLETARRVLGPDVPIVVPFDHHGIMTRLKMANLNGLVGHRTQPHQPFDTGYWAAKQLFAIVRGDVRPTIAWHRIPMIAHQEQFLTARGPMKQWFDRAREMEKMDKVVAVSPFPMQPWLDVPEGGWVTVVVTNNDQELANKLSAELAQMVWDMREQFWVYESIPIAEAVQRAVAAEKGLVILSDTGDSVFGGATGDSTVILRELVKQQVPDLALVPIVDAESTRQCWQAGVGSTVDLVLGGKLDPLFGKPFEVTAKVLALGEGVIEVTMGIRSEYDMGKRALLEIGNVRVVVSENVGVGGNHPSVYQSFGIEPATAKMAVLKTASNFQYYADITSQIIRVDSVGPTMSHLEQFDWQSLPRPIYPLDELPTWQATPETANIVAAANIA
jgi:microcystin degradation protein MlrC